MTVVNLGIYEKALAGHPRTESQWQAFFQEARDLGFSFVDLSIDESFERQERLEWSVQQRAIVRRAASDAGVMIGGLCLSAHRRIAPGSSDPQMRQQAKKVMEKRYPILS